MKFHLLSDAVYWKKNVWIENYQNFRSLFFFFARPSIFSSHSDFGSKSEWFWAIEEKVAYDKQCSQGHSVYIFVNSYVGGRGRYMKLLYEEFREWGRFEMWGSWVGRLRVAGLSEYSCRLGGWVVRPKGPVSGCPPLVRPSLSDVWPFVLSRNHQATCSNTICLSRSHAYIFLVPSSRVPRTDYLNIDRRTTCH